MMKIWDKNRIGIYFFVVLFTALLVPSIIGHGQEPTDEPTVLTVEEVLQEAQNDGIKLTSFDLHEYFPSGKITTEYIQAVFTKENEIFKQERACYDNCITYLNNSPNESLAREELYLSKINIPADEISQRVFRDGYTCKLDMDTSLADWYFILSLNACIQNGYKGGANLSVQSLLYAWGKLIEKKNPGEEVIGRLSFLDSARRSIPTPVMQLSSTPNSTFQIETQISSNANVDLPNNNWGWKLNYLETQTATYSLTLTQFAETQNAGITGTAAATKTQIAGTETAAAAETQIAAAATAAAAETQIAAAATATEQARLEKKKKKDLAISITLGVIGLGAAVFLFIFTQRKRKAAYQMRFEQRRINAVPSPHLFDVEPKARPASAVPSGVSAGGEGNFERSITIEPAEELSDSATMEIDMGSSSVLRYDFGNIQHQGSREYQEDSFGFSDVADPNLVASRGILAVLADGMGGLKNGKSISERTVAKFRKAFMSFTPGVEVPRQLYSLVHETNAEIYQTDKQKGGTTLICVYIYGNSMYWVSVGDSAIYLFRQGRMYQLNREHNRLNDLYLRFMYREITKAQLLAEPTLQGLTSNIGRKELRDVDQNLRELRLRRGDRILLCSDGVSGRLTEKEMLVAMSQGNAQKCTDALKNFVLKKKAPKQDNLTAQVISCD